MAKRRDWGSLQKIKAMATENSNEYLREHRYDTKPKSKAHARYLKKQLTKFKEEPKLVWCRKCNRFKQEQHECL